MARSNWVAPEDVTETINSKIQKGALASDLYKGRCFILRKIGFKTNRLRNHYKTLRPLHCYTLRRKVSDNEASEYSDNEELDNIALQAELSESSQLKAEENKLDTKSDTTYKEKDEYLDKSSKESVPLELGTKKRTHRSVSWRKENNIKEKPKKKSRSKQAFENLKAAKQGNRGLKPCTCDDGKELTVVIKGFCLCDKSNINKFKINKVCEELENSQKPKKKSWPHPIDSIEVHKKRLGMKSSIEKIDHETKQVEDLPEKPVKSVVFKENVDNKNMSDSLITLFRSKLNKRSEMALTREQFERIKQVTEEQNEKEAEEKK